MTYTEDESDWLSGKTPPARPDDRCSAGRAACCPREGELPRIYRLDYETAVLERERQSDGSCMLFPIHPDGTRGNGFSCRQGDAAWQIEKLYLRDGG